MHGINTDNSKVTKVKISECGSLPKVWDICVCTYPKNVLNELQIMFSV